MSDRRVRVTVIEADSIYQALSRLHRRADEANKWHNELNKAADWRKDKALRRDLLSNKADPVRPKGDALLTVREDLLGIRRRLLESGDRVYAADVLRDVDELVDHLDEWMAEH